MCQVVPYTLPCCRKVYVDISKLPSCPRSWPNRKCPAELCIQVHGYEPEDRGVGICWRCKARNAGASSADRESLRPRIDKATLALGLEEVSLVGRRRREEKNGNCWFCGATGGCKTCGAKHIVVAEDEDRTAIQTGKRKRDQGTIKGKEVLKKVKMERRERKATMKAFEYITPNNSDFQQPYPQSYDERPQKFDQIVQTHNQNYKSNVFSSGRVQQPDVLDHLEAEPFQQIISANWRPTRTYQNYPTEPLNAFGAQQMGHFTKDGRQANSMSHYYSNQHLLGTEPEEYTNIRHGGGTSRADAPELWFDHMNHDEEQLGAGPQYHLNEHLSRPDQSTMQEDSRQERGSPGLSNNDPEEQQSSLYRLSDEQQDLIAQQYGGYSYSSYPYPNMHSEAQDAQNPYGYPSGHVSHYQMTQVVGDDIQHTFEPEKTSQISVLDSVPDPNIQPGLDDFPPEFDVTKLDDATLARLLKKYGNAGGENSHADMNASHEFVNGIGSAYAGAQNAL